MNKIFIMRLSCAIALMAPIIWGNSHSAMAQTADSDRADAIPVVPSETVPVVVPTTQLENEPVTTEILEAGLQGNGETAMPVFRYDAAAKIPELEQIPIASTDASEAEPIAVLNSETPSEAGATELNVPEADAIAQRNREIQPGREVQPGREIQPGRSTRSGYSYIGFGVNVGLDDSGSALGNGSFAIFSKIGLTRQFSVRPAVLLGDNAVLLVPVTLDFPPADARLVRRSQPNIAPYLGAGVAIATGDDSSVGALITGGIDVPFTRQWTATFGVNAGLFGGDNFELGLLVGAGYNF